VVVADRLVGYTAQFAGDLREAQRRIERVLALYDALMDRRRRIGSCTTSASPPTTCWRVLCGCKGSSIKPPSTHTGSVTCVKFAIGRHSRPS